MDDMTYLFGVFVAMMLVNFVLRALPFVLGKRLMSYRWVSDLGKFLPLSIMALLALHATVGAARAHDGLPIPEIVAILLTVSLQWFLRNSLLSIFLGTTTYVVVLNVGFIS